MTRRPWLPPDLGPEERRVRLIEAHVIALGRAIGRNMIVRPGSTVDRVCEGIGAVGVGTVGAGAAVRSLTRKRPEREERGR